MRGVGLMMRGIEVVGEEIGLQGWGAERGGESVQGGAPCPPGRPAAAPEPCG